MHFSAVFKTKYELKLFFLRSSPTLCLVMCQNSNKAKRKRDILIYFVSNKACIQDFPKRDEK